MAPLPRTPVTDSEIAHWLELHAQGHSVRAIAQQAGRAHGTISTYLNRAGADMNRSQTAEATAARVAIVNARRLAHAEDLLDDIDSIRHRIWNECVIVANGPDGPVKVHLDEPPLKEQADGLRSIGSLVKAIDELLADVGTNTTAAAAKSVITGIFDGLAAIIHDTPADPDDRDHDYNIADDPNENKRTDDDEEDGGDDDMMWVDCDCADPDTCDCEDYHEDQAP